ncbi:hypothetical protein PP175_05970 [Aneurinibacillus sp. Ricciae_BoGa-3]|uniref:hypothetical protein n=1 Tax=Aneurinibacillus sp. Ricciae_BoGa-3 TaxID=3022697 RepID=UPI002340D0A7|nr:hypothetical protein [Aneurinibacillus sp. Ricciae_BoGa-3]WCK55495.1 hypothetical protein PP175_05970 [Aneurinibacillus sp. Ricciae_BoGa-3]
MEQKVISWDGENKQLLSTVCRRCPEPHFQPRTDELGHIGCCAYEPVFTLYEIYAMIRAGEEKYFLESIYHNPLNTIHPYEIMAGGRVHPSYYGKKDGEALSPHEKADALSHNPRTRFLAVDEKLSYTVCQFFIDGKGCGLDPRFKTSICRSFICQSIEDKLSEREREQLDSWRRSIREEAEPFHRYHKKILEREGITLLEDVHAVMDYFRKLLEAEKTVEN